MPYLDTGHDRPDTTARIYLPTPAVARADGTVAIDPPRPARYIGKRRRPGRGVPRIATVAALLAIWTTALVVGWDAMTGMAGR